MSRLLLCLVLLLLAGCETTPRAVMQQLPPLDAALRAPCRLPDPPPAALVDYDARDDYVQHVVLPALADCAVRKAAIVEAWDRVRAGR